MTDQPVLQFEDVSVSYTTAQGSLLAVDRISLDVRRGEAFGIVGESGSGKTSLAYAVLGVLPDSATTSGVISIDGSDTASLSANEIRRLRGSTVSLVPQDALSALDPTFSIGSQLVEVIRSRQNISRHAARQSAIDLLSAVGIERPASRFSDPPHRFSGGMRQRVCIAIALANEPTIVVADEPTTALDVTIQKQILDLLAELQQSRDLTLLLITHDLGVVRQVCDRVGVMYAGQLVEVGPTELVLTTPEHPYSSALLQSIPNPGRRRGELRVIAGEVPDMHSPPAGCRFRTRCGAAMDICINDPPIVHLGSGFARCWLVADAPPTAAEAVRIEQAVSDGANDH